MVPFRRRTAEAEQVIAEMARHGLKRVESGLEIFVVRDEAAPLWEFREHRDRAEPVPYAIWRDD